METTIIGFKDDNSLILLTGATGYVGGRLLGELESRGCRVRCMARRPEFLEGRAQDSTEIVQGDVLDPESLVKALDGVRIAYYMVHSMGSSGSFEEEDRIAAQNFGEAAWQAGVEGIVYLGGLGDAEEELSSHLRSRQEVGEILMASGVPVLEFRASVIIGSGSLSFEMIRSLVERLPIMITPKWVSVVAQPLAIDDLLAYLLAAIDLPLSEYGIFEIGGADPVSYGEIMQTYARCRGRRIRMLPVPVLTPYLSSLWLGLITPLYARVGRKLIAGIVNSTVVRDDRARRTFAVDPMGIESAIQQALTNEDKKFAATRWSDALSSSGQTRSWGGVHFGSRLLDSRTIDVPLSAEEAFVPIESIGGDVGWYAWDTLWNLRGTLDLLVGGPGMRRGRPNPSTLRPGDTVDFWRVEHCERPTRLLLSAEMKLPGRAWLEFEVEPQEEGCRIRQTAIFDPVGLSGLLYWYALFPVHELVFSGMLRGLKRAALQRASEPE